MDKFKKLKDMLAGKPTYEQDQEPEKAREEVDRPGALSVEDYFRQRIGRDKRKKKDA